MDQPQEKRGRGRPKGSAKPKELKVPGKKGRPSLYPDELQPTSNAKPKVPALFNDAMKDQEFRQEFINIMLAFSLRK